MTKSYGCGVCLYDAGAYWANGEIIPENEAAGRFDNDSAAKNTITYGLLAAHNTSGDTRRLKLKFDAAVSHDITYVGIIQTARASGLTEFPLPYALTNCHNSLCAVGGTINEDDHAFGLSAAKKYGGIYVPAHGAVIHQYARETLAVCGGMLLGSDSHTRYGALGCMAIGEGGGEIAKQLLGKTYDVPYPRVVGVYLSGKPSGSVGPMDVALALIRAVFANGYVKNSVMEFIGDGLKNLSADFRIGIDVMTTETSCLSSVFATDDTIREFYKAHGRAAGYKEIPEPKEAFYDGFIKVDLSKIRPMIALPFHPSNAYEIAELNANLDDILRETERKCNEQLDAPNITVDLRSKLTNGKLLTDQRVIAGCAGGTFENICAAANILKNAQNPADISVYPASMPIYSALAGNGVMSDLLRAGATVRSAFCGPCFGAGDVPRNGALSVRHTTRNFPNREGSKPSAGQIACVALMDAKSIAATAANGGLLTEAPETDFTPPPYFYDDKIYSAKVYNGFGKARPETELVFGPNIADWPKLPPLPEHLLLRVAAFITDPVTTTDELIPSGETSSYRSNPLALAEFTLSRKDPGYVARAKAAVSGEYDPAEAALLDGFLEKFGARLGETGVASCVYANKPGDGSAREQAASCQRVLGGAANIAREYATKRYRSNLINWGMLPFIIESEPPFGLNDYIFLPNIRNAVEEGKSEVPAYLPKQNGGFLEFRLQLPEAAPDERAIILAGCLINHYKK
ncbi:MAG: hydratase [Clostridiales bacterium]|jgi:aconitate hydratase|nr:hydratase [Clostridiales bacterium]